MERIDLHLHSEVSRSNGDSIQWESDYFVIKKLLSKKIKIASFTDHNIFDYDHYERISTLAKKAGVLILPGIEVNVVRKNGKLANMLYIFSDKLSIQELKKIDLKSRQLRKSGISLKEVNTFFLDFQPLLIPHVGKSDYFSTTDLKEIEYHAIEISNANHINYKSWLKSGVEKSVVAFSDTHAWNHYPQLKKLWTEMELYDISFHALEKSFSKNQNYTKGYR